MTLKSDDTTLTIQKIIKSRAGYYCKILQSFDFDDLVQDGWVLFYKKKHLYDPENGAKLSTWFYSVLNRFYLDKLKVGFKEKKFCGVVENIDAEVIEPENNKISRDIILSDSLELLHNTLSPLCYRYLIAKLNKDGVKSIKRIANNLGISKKSVLNLKAELQNTAGYFLCLQ